MISRSHRHARAYAWTLVLLFGCAAQGGVTPRFAPHEGMVKAVEQPVRAEICLNGLWQFQPVALPAGYRRGQSPTPELSAPVDGGWEKTPIKIPSPWNVNTWGPGRRGRDVGEGTPRPYQPDSEYYPSYPRSWDDVQMGWLRRSFRVPAEWKDKRLTLHFEAVAGGFEVRVNGVKAGEHFDSHLPAEFDVTALVRPAGDNELLVGVRHPSLFERKSARYPKFNAPFPPGSNTDRLAGIWQDVFLLALPPVRVADLFIQPDLEKDRLDVVATLRNDTNQPQTVELSGTAHPWSGTTPESSWKLGEAVLSFGARSVRVERNATVDVTLSIQPRGRLKTWSPDAPNLYGLVLSVHANNVPLDTCYERFGWRQLTIHGREVRLNGQPIQMFGDFSHPFGPFMMSRRFAWAWCTMIKDCGGNLLRPHAQPYPRYYLDVADEMGILVLDETAVFGSSIRLNPEVPEFWARYEQHYERLIRRDRNHPSVFGWSFGNEMFAIPVLNKMSPADTAEYYAKLAAVGLRGRELDPTRAWISCDGDEDLGGKLPVWSKHHGLGVPAVPALDKPMMIGESGGTYYATPKQLAVFNGERAYESYRRRNEAMAIDLYENLVQLALPRLASFSPSEMVWFGLEHLPLGKHDFTRLPTPSEGILFGPFEEGRPGMQPERIPPYCSTLNPGWDPDLPLYKPLPMFHAMKAALARGGPRPCEWDHRPKLDGPKETAPQPTIDQVGFIGDRAGTLGRKLVAWGVPLATSSPAPLVVVDADTASVDRARPALDHIRAYGGVALVMAGARLPAGLLPVDAQLTDRAATALVPDREHPWTKGLTLPQLYFAEDGAERFILRHGAAGPFVEKGRVLLQASNTDWSQFNGVPEHAKAGATVLYEQLAKPSGAALIEHPHGQGKVVLCTLNVEVADPFWRLLLTRMGVVLKAPQQPMTPAFNDAGVLVNALSIGRFGAADLESALGTDFVGSAAPRSGQKVKERAWATVNSPSKDRFVFHQLKQAGPSDAFAVYFSCWIKSPRALDDLLLAGPDVPRLNLFCYVSERCRLFLNGQELTPSRSEPADYRTRLGFEGLALKKGWNHLLFKLASTRLEGDGPATLAVRIASPNPEFFRQLESAVELANSEAAPASAPAKPATRSTSLDTKAPSPLPATRAGEAIPPGAAPADRNAIALEPGPTNVAGIGRPDRARKPNVVYLLADDLGWGDLSAHGGSIPTPHIDRLFKQGVELRNFMGWCVCSPTRAMLLTGRHPFRVGTGPEVGGELAREETTLAEAFKANDYRTGVFGKWHNGEDPDTPEYRAAFKEAFKDLPNKQLVGGLGVNEHGFDEAWVYYGGGADYFTRRTVAGRGPVSWWRNREYRPRDEGYTEDLITQRAIEFIRQNKAQPFFCYVPFHIVHAPLQAKEADLKKVAANVPEGSARLYAAMVQAMDQNVGAVLAELDALGLRDNTIVIFTSDNGATKEGRNAPLKGGKHSLYEGGVRLPTVMHWPQGQVAGRTWEGLCGAMDMFPTLIAMAGGQMPPTRPLDGKNLWPALRDSGASSVESYYWTWHGQDAIRTPQWKLHRFFDRFELYDIREDEGETTNLADQHPDVVKTLAARMDEWATSLGAALSHRWAPAKLDAKPAPEGEALEVTVTVTDKAKPKDRLIVQIAAKPFFHEATDWIEFDIGAAPDGLQKGFFYSPTRGNPTTGIAPHFRRGDGVDQWGREQVLGPAPQGGPGTWEHRAIGLCSWAPGPLGQHALVFTGGKPGTYRVWLDNLRVHRTDGSVVPLWTDGKDTRTRKIEDSETFTKLRVRTIKRPAAGEPEAAKFSPRER